MDADDFRTLVAVVEAELAASGLADLADPVHYLSRIHDEADLELSDPQARVIAMLEAFERVLAVNDGRTYAKAMSLLQEVCHGNGPSDAVYLPPQDGDLESEVSLSKAPLLYPIREELRGLIGTLREAGSSLEEPA